MCSEQAFGTSGLRNGASSEPETCLDLDAIGYDSQMSRRIMVGAFSCLVALVAFSGPAGAAPNVVDQYTEQIPTPGGKKPANSVGNNTGSKGSNSNGSNSNGNSSVGGAGSGSGSDGGSGSGSGYPAGGDYSTSYATGNGSDNGGPAGANGNGSASVNGNSASGANGSAGSGDSAGSSSTSSSELAAEAARAATANSDGGGMGWLFPAILIGAAVILGGLTIVRSNKRSHTPA